jgi:hypothetical protein
VRIAGRDGPTQPRGDSMESWIPIHGHDSAVSFLRGDPRIEEATTASEADPKSPTSVLPLSCY